MEYLEKVELNGRWPQQACTTMFVLIPKNITSERPIALMPTLIRLWEALRASEVTKSQQKYRVDWDATDGRNGGAQQTVWEILLEMERFNGKAKEQDQGALALSSLWHRQRAKRVQPRCCCSWKHMASKWRRHSPPWPLSIGQKEPGLENGIMNKKEAWMKQVREVQTGERTCWSGDVRDL